ncbi:MAG: ribosome maturation factor RimP [Deltaproteobacteria bacterium]|nr:ribosome maturation factor RimP [Deltaproteobacteria bacterium]
METYGEEIRRLAEPVVESEAMELICVECLRMKSRWLVRLYLDKEGGVTIEDCSEVSNQLGDLLDVHDIPPGPYTLEVSSPGLNRPIERDQDFMKFKGHKVQIKVREKLEGMKIFRGTLVDFISGNGEKTLVVDVSGRFYRIPMALVAKARLEETV